MNKINEIIDNVVNNFLQEYRKTNNNGKLVSINENDIKRIISTHSNNGYIVVSPCRGGADFGIDPTKSKSEYDKLAHINKTRIKSIIDDIKKSGFFNFPIFLY